MFRSTKTFPPISCAFRQWRAKSHCRFLHGYALTFTIEFEAEELDDRNWVVDFGALKGLKEQIEAFYDHKTVVAEDDPEATDLFQLMNGKGIVQLRWLPAVGCEAFAKHVAELADYWLETQALKGRVWVAEVECREHGANAAKYFPPSQK